MSTTTPGSRSPRRHSGPVTVDPARVSQAGEAAATSARSDAWSSLVGLVAHGEPWPRRVMRSAGRTLASGRGPRELAELASRVQQPVTTGRRIAVASVRGGAGKSAVAALLASVFAARRGDPVLAVDADATVGSLTWRLGASARQSRQDLARRLQDVRVADLAGLASLLPRTAGGLWLLPGGAGGSPTLTRDVTRWLSRLFALCVADCGPGMTFPTATALLGDAHAVVVVVPATPDGVRSTCQALNYLAGVAGGTDLLRRVVIAVNPTAPPGSSALRRRAAANAFAPYRVPVVDLCYDRHLAAGAVIEPASVAEPSLTAVTRLAAQALRTALKA